MTLTGFLVLTALALSLGWLISGRRILWLRTLGLLSLGLSLILFFTTQ